DGLETVLEALRPHARGRLIVVFGAGGDRDRSKRPLMGGAAGRLSDVAIVTDDNPRSEAPASIRAAILAAAPGAKEIGDRRTAIRAAIADLRGGDVLLIAGKGHETGQIIGDRTIPFSDHEAVAAALKELAACACRRCGPSKTWPPRWEPNGTAHCRRRSRASQSIRARSASAKLSLRCP